MSKIVNRKQVPVIENYTFILFCDRPNQRKAISPRNTRNNLVWTNGNGDTMHEVRIPHKIPRAGGILEEADTRIIVK